MTTIRVDAIGIGVKTGELLLNLFEKSDTEEMRAAASSLIDVGFKLIERQTVARRKV
jgi:LacI family gluconate utilization system Gnt-I transcriptional repressor